METGTVPAGCISEDMMASGFFVVFLGIAVLLSLIMAIFFVFLWCRICGKTGYHWALGLLYLFPLGGPLILLCILAFSKWPIQKQIESGKS